jgi:gamma-glutamylcyclotransferase (GGCT)/AIG2-like uncharacterized protein YtfP
VTFFSYGTLLDPEYQRELFGRSVPTEAAAVRDWRAVFTESGYLTIVRAPGAVVHGALIAVDERELAICDAWEDVPLYTRVDVRATRAGDGAAIDTWAYVRAVDGGEPAPPGTLARASRADIIRAIRRFRADGAGHISGT